MDESTKKRLQSTKEEIEKLMKEGDEKIASAMSQFKEMSRKAQNGKE